MPNSDSNKAAGASQKPSASPPRRVPGNLPYLNASGTLKTVLERIIEAQRPDRFSQDYLENVLKLKGGSPRGTIPILKRMGFLASDGTPTELYAKFKTEGGRATAAFHGLRNAYAEIYKRSEYAHLADDNKIRDIIVEITGLEKGHQVATAIKGTFNVIRGYIPKGFTPSSPELPSQQSEEENNSRDEQRFERQSYDNDAGGLRLAYNINIVLPETSDLSVLNAIFKSIKENLLR